MKTMFASKTILFAAICILLPSVRCQSAENVVDAIELVRGTYKYDRQALLAETMHFSESESAVFWPLYRSYRADMDKLGDELLKLVLEYADAYPNVPEDRARRLLKDYTELEEKLASKRAWYLKRAAKSLPAAKVLRWAQLENRMDLGLRLQLAGTIPLVPAQPSK
jgi:hypothetical protein